MSWKLRTLNYTARFIELADEINKSMPQHVVNKVVDALNDDGKAVRGSRILMLGVAYKPDVSDTRESPALDIIQLLLDKGGDVAFHDPLATNLHHEQIDMESVPLTDAVLAAADCVVVTTNHAVFAWDQIVNKAHLIVDTRHAVPRDGAARVISI